MYFGGGLKMRKIAGLFLMGIIITLLIGCGDKRESKNRDNNVKKSKYEIENLGFFSVTDKDFENFYSISKDAALANIDTLGKNDYLGPEKSAMVIFENNSIAFLLHAVDKPDVNDNTVLVTYHYDSNQNKHIRATIQYNQHQYADN